MSLVNVEHVGLMVAGRERSGAGEPFVTYDPSTGEVIGRLTSATDADVDEALQCARDAQPAWHALGPAARGRLLSALSDLLLAHHDELARLEARDCGKVLTQARNDIAIAARYLEFFGGVCPAFGGQEIRLGSHVTDFTVRDPYGVCAQVNAWNFPLNMAARSMAAALAVGNCVVIKAPELAPCTTAILGRMALHVGIPPGVVNVLHGGADTGALLSRHPHVDLITFTGSTTTGRMVAKSAAENTTPCILELGGKSPTVVFADADVNKAADQLAVSFVDANGQSCDLPSLALVHELALDQFRETLVARAKRLRIAPSVDDADIGPLISERQLARVERYVAIAVDEGAEVLTGGQRPLDERLSGGHYYEPTILTGMSRSSPVVQEEIFGPVLAILPFACEDEAIEVANSTMFGLAAFVWTRDVGRAIRLTKEIHAGQVYVNCFGSGDPVMTPFGGFKSSGYGREKGFEALLSYTQTKNVCLSAQ